MEKNEVKVETPETVSKEAYDAVVAENNKLKAAFNKALVFMANNYAEGLAKNIFAEVEKEAANASESK